MDNSLTRSRETPSGETYTEGVGRSEYRIQVFMFEPFRNLYIFFFVFEV